jgi:hypothetical protein
VSHESSVSLSDFKQCVHPEIKGAIHRGSDPASLGKLFPASRRKFSPSSSRFEQLILYVRLKGSR